MAQTIKIKRSTGSSAPSTLAVGELAYTKGTNVLYVGDPATANTPIDIVGDRFDTKIAATDLQDLNNVSDTAPGAGQNGYVLTWNNTAGEWEAAAGAAGSLAGLSDTTITSVGNGEVLYYNSGWVNATLSEAGIQAADANTAKYDDTTANFTGTLQNGGSNVVVDSDIGSTVQAYDADLTTLAGLSSADSNFIVGSASGWVVESGATARASLGVDAAGTDNSTDVTLVTTTADYLSLSGQAITLGLIDLAADVTGSLPNGNLANSSITIGDNTIALGGTDTDITGLTSLVVDNVSVDGNTITTSTGGLTLDSTGGTVTVSDNLTVSGDLTVNGTTTTISTTNTVVEDSLIELGNGTTGTPANDAGIVIERGDSANAFFGWDESADKFIVGTGTFTGASTGDLTITTGTLVANVEGDVTGDLTGNADTATTAGALSSAVTVSLSGDVSGSATFTSAGDTASITTTIGAGAVDFAMLAGAAVQTGTEVGASGATIGDNDTSVLTAAAVINYVEGDTLSTIQISSSDSSITGTGTSSTRTPNFDLQVGTIDGGTY
jgi:hypothetical protein